MADNPKESASAHRIRRAKRIGRRVATLVREPERITPAIRRRVRSPIISKAERGAARAAARAAAKASNPTRPATAVGLGRGARIKIIGAELDLAHGLGLEIGPSHNPLLRKSEGYNIRIADHLDQAGLIAKYSYKNTAHIEPVDYVLAPGRLTDTITDRFDYIIASHVAEHTVCLISFLQDCRQLLEPGGALSLALPDMRFCFDRFRERVSLGRVIDVYHAAPKVHTPGMVTEHFLFNAERDSKITWFQGFSGGEYRFRVPTDRVQDAAAQAATGEYVDTHNWVLTPNHFRLLLHDLRELGYIDLHERAFVDTVDHEFFVTLSTEPGPDGTPSREELVERSARELLALDVPHFA